jgi:hypothetical protein
MADQAIVLTGGKRGVLIKYKKKGRRQKQQKTLIAHHKTPCDLMLKDNRWKKSCQIRQVIPEEKYTRQRHA